MPRTYKPAAKQYKKYSESSIEAALREYENASMSLAQISKKHEIPKSVLHRHNTRFMKKQGGQTVLSEEEEGYIIELVNQSAEWGYPMSPYDLRVLIKGYLDRIGTNVKRFKENLPGPDYVKNFLRRNKDKISVRVSQNIERSRANVSPEVIEEYFHELKQLLDGVPLCNIVNYDETNLSDDPGKRKIVTKRRAKYPERVVNHSKSSTSLMMAAAADGTLLPYYVVYKAKEMHDSWVQNGPKGCRYNCTTSGWFDSNTFEDWVYTVALPYFKNKNGKKIFIGDNLSSHLSLNLIKECKDRDIHFIFLPANATHLTQPLDLAFFRQTECVWRDILYHWKKTEGRNLSTTPKSSFPTLLNILLNHIEPQASSNIITGFMKSGISPLNKNKVLERMSGICDADDKKFDKDMTMGNIVVEMRYGCSNKKTSNKRKKIQIKPGQSVCTDDEESETSESEYSQEQSNCTRKASSHESDSEKPLEASGRLTVSTSNTIKEEITEPSKPQDLIVQLIPKETKIKSEPKSEKKKDLKTIKKEHVFKKPIPKVRKVKKIVKTKAKKQMQKRELNMETEWLDDESMLDDNYKKTDVFVVIVT